MKFKIDQIVTVVEDSDFVFKPGEKVRIVTIDEDDEIPYYCRHEDGREEWMYEEDLKASSRATFKVAALLRYHQDGENLFEEFQSISNAKDRAKSLAALDDVERESLVVYEIKSKKVVKVDTRISLKAA